MASRGTRPAISRALLAGGAAAAIALVVVLVIAAPRVSPSPSLASSAPRGSVAGQASTVAPPPSSAPSAIVERAPEPPVATVVGATTEVIRSPLTNRSGPTVVWTGSEAIVWGGWPVTPREGISPPAEGAAYDPAGDDWRMLPDAPIRGLSDHLAVWTGREMLVWGGYTQIRPKPPSVGAAYNPKNGRWRTLAPAPMRWASGATSVWADGEWIIAIARDRTDGIEVAAYDPRRDRWRELPRVPGTLSEENQLVWTGSELLLMNSAAGMYRLATGADMWTKANVASERVDPIVWTGDRLLGIENSLSGWSLVVWDSVSDTWSRIPEPAREIYEHEGLGEREFVWAGDRALLMDSVMAFHTDTAFAYDPLTAQWWTMRPASGFDSHEGVQVWADDRLLVLGGPQYHPEPGPPFGRAWIPEW